MSAGSASTQLRVAEVARSWLVVRQPCPSASASSARSYGISVGMSPLTISQTI